MILHDALDVLLGQITVLIQHLAKAEGQPLILLGIDTKRDVSGDILTKVQQCLTVGSLGNGGGEMLMLRHGNIIGCGGDHLVGRYLCFTAVRRFPVGVVYLPVLVVGKPDGAIVAPIPAFICNNGITASIRIGDLQLGKQLRFRTILISDSPCTDAAPVPAVCQLNGQDMIAGGKHIRHIIGLVLHPLAVIRMSGRKAEVADFLSIQFCLIQAAGCDIQTG